LRTILKLIWSTVQRTVHTWPLLFLGAIALIPRLYNLNSPIIGIHAWRQADTAAMARNLYERTQTHSIFQYAQLFLNPQVDWGGGGIAETEFPIYPAIVSGIYQVTGAHTAYARLLSILFSLLTLYFLYRLVELCFSRSVAFWAALFFAISPVSIFYGRSVQPESLVMMGTMGSLYFFKRWITEEKRWTLLISWGLSAIACLTKVLPLIYLGIPLFFLAALKYRTRIFRQVDLWIFTLGLLGITLAWYHHAHQIYLQTGLTFGFWSADTNRYTWGDLISFKYWIDIIFRLAVRHFAVFGFIIALIGFTDNRKNSADYLWEIGLASSLLASAVAPRSSYIHEYYQLPVMLYGLVFIGKVYGRVFSLETEPFTEQKSLLSKRRSARALSAGLALTFVTSALIYSIDYLSPENIQTSQVYQWAQQIKANTPADATVLATTGGDPTLLYLANRKGWLIHPQEVSIEKLNSASANGADFLVGSYSIIQSYVAFEDAAQKKSLQTLLTDTCRPILNDTATFIVPLRCDDNIGRHR